MYGINAISVWRRENDIYMAVLGRPETRVGTGRDPVVDSVGKHLDVAWSSPQGMMLMRDGGPHTPLGDGRFPSVLALDRRTVLAWEQQGTVQVVTIPR